MLNLAEMGDLCRCLRLRATLGCETRARSQKTLQCCFESNNSSIFAHLLTRRDPPGPFPPVARAVPSPPIAGLTSDARAVDAGPRAGEASSFSRANLARKHRDSNQTEATSGSSGVELTKGVRVPGSAARPGAALLDGRPASQNLDFRVEYP